jgi:hypothetical protein
VIVRVRDDFHEGLGELLMAILKMSGINAMRGALAQYLCGKVHPGHRYKVGVIHTEVDFIFDPTVTCIKCGAVMSDDAYTKMVTEYAALISDEEMSEEDEVW